MACDQMTCAVLLFDRPMSHQIVSAFLCFKHFRTLEIVTHININHVSKLGVFLPTTSAHCLTFPSKPDTGALLSLFLLPTLLQLRCSGPSAKRPTILRSIFRHITGRSHIGEVALVMQMVGKAYKLWPHNGVRQSSRGALQ